jgi:hypothetical protein
LPAVLASSSPLQALADMRQNAKNAAVARPLTLTKNPRSGELRLCCRRCPPWLDRKTPLLTPGGSERLISRSRRVPTSEDRRAAALVPMNQRCRLEPCSDCSPEQGFCGAPPGFRTQNLRIKSRALGVAGCCRLSQSVARTGNLSPSVAGCRRL